jgi:hypothetical protein
MHGLRYTIQKIEFCPSIGLANQWISNIPKNSMVFELDIHTKQVIWLPGTKREERFDITNDLEWSFDTEGGMVKYSLVLHDYQGAIVERYRLVGELFVLVAREHYVSEIGKR